MTISIDLPKELQVVLTNIAQALLNSQPLPEGDYGTALFDPWLRTRSKSGRPEAAIAFLDKTVCALSDNKQAIVASRPEYFARPTGGGLLIALTPKNAKAKDSDVRHICIAAANINGVFESRQEDFGAIEL